MISFVVPAHNEEFELPAALAAIRHAAGGVAHEVVVVDDASTDTTARIAREAGARVVRIDRRQIAAARNAGARGALGRVLIFVDADTRIAAVHVRGVVDALERGCVGGGARLRAEGVPFWGRVFVALFSALYFGANLAAGAFLFTTRENFDRAGGFDERYFAGEEVYFSQALKKLGRFVILREPAMTSGRKLRMHSGRELFVQLCRMIRGGPASYRSRERLGVWYDGKRETRERFSP